MPAATNTWRCPYCGTWALGNHSCDTMWPCPYCGLLVHGTYDDYVEHAWHCTGPPPKRVRHECEHQASNFTPCRVCGA